MKLARKEAPGNNLRPKHSHGPFATAGRLYLLVDDIIKKGYDKGSEKLQQKLGLSPKGAYVFTVTAFIGAQTVMTSAAWGVETGISAALLAALNGPTITLWMPKDEFEPVKVDGAKVVEMKNAWAKCCRLPMLGGAMMYFANGGRVWDVSAFLLLNDAIFFYAISSSGGILERAWKTVKGKIAALNAKPACDSVSKFENGMPAG